MFSSGNTSSLDTNSKTMTENDGEVENAEHRGSNALRTEVREPAKVSEDVLKSTRRCSLKEHLDILNKHISNLEKNSSENASACICSLIDHLKGLRAVLQVLLAKIPTEKGPEVLQSCPGRVTLHLMMPLAFILPTRKEKLRFL